MSVWWKCFLINVVGLIMKKLPMLLSLLLILTSCGNSGSLSAQEKRNNFDSCKISFLKQITEKDYKANQSAFDKQSEEVCAPLLNTEAPTLKNFPIPKPIGIESATKSSASFQQVCDKVKKAAYAHNEMTNYDDDADDYYDRWYGKIRSYFRDAATIMRSLNGNYTGLIADAQSASTSARGVNAGGLSYAEERLYSACNISEDVVSADFMKWLDKKYPDDSEEDLEDLGE